MQETVTPRELGNELLRSMPVLPRRRAVWKTAMLAVTPMTLKMVAAAGIAPASPPLQRGANLSQLNSQKWSLREVTLLGLSVISRWLCF